MNLLFKVLSINNRELFEYLSYEDHKNLSIAFMDKYVPFLLDRVNYRKKTPVDYDDVVKMVLSAINVNRLNSTTLNRLHRGFWNHISLNCRLKERFVYRWSHKINMFRFKLNNNCRGYGGDDGQLLPRPFSNKFKARFPGINEYKPCSICFEDTDYHYNRFFIEHEWVCENCMYDYEDESEFDYNDMDYLPSDRHWSEDDTDYEN